MLRDIRQPDDKEKHKQLKDDADRVLRFLDDYRDTKRALVIFSDASENFFWVRELNVKARKQWCPGATNLSYGRCWN